MNTPEIVLTTTDIDRLEQLLDTLSSSVTGVDTLRQELARASIVSPQHLPVDVVSMNSTVRFTLGDGKSSCLTLVYPKDADRSGEKISVLAPVGSALLGLRTGDSINWPLPSGIMSTIKVNEIIYQPEREGAYHR